MSRLGRAICPDGRPADLIVEEDGTTWLRLEAHGVMAWANLEELRRPPVPARVYVGPVGSTPESGPWTHLGYVRGADFTVGGVL